MATTEFQGRVRARPLRFAFLVQDGDLAEQVLDGIFADCYGRWGGRFSLVVPCKDGKLLSCYWDWLTEFDPDIVYSYAELDKAEVIEIYERLGPAEFTPCRLPETPPASGRAFKPDYRFEALSSLSCMGTLSRQDRHLANAPQILDTWHGIEPSRFFSDNFGTYWRSANTTAFPHGSGCELLRVVPPEIVANRQYGIDSSTKIIASEQEALRTFAAHKATSLSVLSASLTPRLEIRSGEWSGSFNLVVGGSFEDRVLFWNARSLIPSWLDRDLCCFRVSLDQMEDPSFVDDLVKLLQNRNFVNGGGGGQACVTIRSISVPAQKLEEIAEVLRCRKLWGPIGTESVKDLGSMVPSATALKHAVERGGAGNSWDRSLGWTEFHWSGVIARPPTPFPKHLSDGLPNRHFSSGMWSTDYLLENDAENLRFDTNIWRLPKRWRMASAFRSKRLKHEPFSIPPQARTARGGCLAFTSSTENPILEIEIPTVRHAFDEALVRGRWAQIEEDAPSPNCFTWSRASSEASYFSGVIGLAGGLPLACMFLLHPFLIDTFARLGATPSSGDRNLSPLLNKLEKFGRRGMAFNLSDSEDREFLADLIARHARTQQMPMDFIAYSDLEKSWADYRKKYWSISAPSRGDADADADAEFDLLEQESLTHCLQSLRHRRMLFQGHKWTCEACGHRNWVNMSGLAPEMGCDVCADKQPAPVAIDWLFRLNEFLLHSLRDHSILSLLWVLDHFREQTRGSLFFVPPTVFGTDDDWEMPKQEADLLIVADGVTYVCEVKNSWTAVRGADIVKLADLAERLRPDVAILAVMERGSRQVSAISRAKERLAKVGIKFSVLLPEAGRRDDSFLPSGERRR